MKTKILALLLVFVFCFSLTACAEGGAQSVIDNVTTGNSGAEDEEEYEIVIPEAVMSISEEDDKALTGTLTEDYYINPYFGLKFNKPEDGTIQSLLDEETDLKLFSQTYESGYGGILIHIRSDNGSISPSVYAISDKDKGKTEEELIQEKMESESGMNEEMGIDSDFETSIETISIAGEDHPAYIELFDDEGEVYKTAYFFILKGDFEISLCISAPIDNFDTIAGLIEKN